VRVGGFVNLRGVRKLTGENPSPWGALPTDLELVRRVRVRAHLLGPERWCLVEESPDSAGQCAG